MSTPQNGIFVEGHRYLHALEYAVSGSLSPTTLTRAINAAKRADAEAVFAFGPQLWAQMGRDHMPSGFTDFQPLNGPKAQAPATQRDILVWVHAPERDQVLDAVLAIDAVLSAEAARELDVPGFVYHDSRDLTGFVDGSANPKDDAAKREAALVPEGEPGAGGAIVFSQKWAHDLAKFNALEVGDQERVIGRTKPDSIELEGDAQPEDSHVSRTDLKVGGIAQKMYRRSFPYGTASEHGLYFLAFCCEQSRFDNVLASMWGMDHGGVTDHLLSFSTPQTGSYWFAPSEESLKAVLV
ncbi:Dyp-type peroxidase [Magnetovibrio sp. PR-2]|uniref:Dyp-type peroxidase n=1 Tax=Magnetovibrio sp. PR-2 TaxID=3120356 RepID=UPI002FCE18C5